MSESQGGGGQRGRSAPRDMPREIASQSRMPRQIEQKRDTLPEQKPIMDDMELSRPPSKISVFLKKAGLTLLVGIALSLTYILLLIFGPMEMDEPKVSFQEETIRVPMAAVETVGGADLTTVASTFGKPVLALYGDPFPLQKVTLYDTAFQGGYARRAALIYTFEDGQSLRLESIRPTAAAALLKTSGSTLHATSRYALAGLDAARIDTSENVYLLAKSDEAVYAVICPKEHLSELNVLIRQTTLVQFQGSGP